MFTEKKSALFEVPKKETTTVVSSFVSAGLKESAKTESGNGALKYKTTGNPFVDQFTFLGSYKAPRPYAEIASDCEILWDSNKKFAVLFIFYIRMITRIVKLFTGISTQKAQKGAELKHEGIMRMIWLSKKSEDIFWKNIGIFVSVGSWKDIFTMLQYDLVYNGWEGRVLNWDKFGSLILSGLDNPQTSELIKKYLPQIKANSACKTVESQADNMIGKWLCSLMFGVKESGASYKKYRKLKSTGTAHEWQKLISQKKMELIDFSKIHGRALNLMVRTKFLKNQGLEEKYATWAEKPETEIKYTGFVHELFSSLPGSLTSMAKHVQDTINKQFETLVNKGKSDDHTTSLIVVRDTSASMGAGAAGTNMPCYNIAKALALYFSEFLKGQFSNSWIEFNAKAQMHLWKGSTPLEKWYNDHTSFVGNTNFMGVIDLLVEIKRQGVAEVDFPSGILCISDSEFDPVSLNQTNVDVAKHKLRMAGFSDEYVDNFVIVLWNLQSRAYGGAGKKFETFGDVPNVFYFSGYSAATVSFLTSKIKNAEELFEEAMNQEILNMVEI